MAETFRGRIYDNITQTIGQTPLVLVDVAGGYFPLRTGDRVRFVRIDEAEFARLGGQRL